MGHPEGQEGEENEERFGDGEAGEDEAEWVGGEQENCGGGGEGVSSGWAVTGDQEPGCGEDSGEDDDGKGSGGDE
jgi:hypothetical protein